MTKIDGWLWRHNRIRAVLRNWLLMIGIVMIAWAIAGVLYYD